MSVRPPLVTRRHVLATIAGGAAAVGAAIAARAFLVKPHELTVTRHALHSRGGGRATVRLVQLTDLHLHGIGTHEQRIANKVRALRPDLLLLTGDSLDQARELPTLARFLDLLDPATPKLAILGNWEHWGHVDLAALEVVYAERNCELLRNASARLRLQGVDVLVTGLDDFVGGRPDLQLALDGAEPCANHLLLAHCPAQRDVLPAPWRRPTPGAGPLPLAGVLPSVDGRITDASAIPAPVAMLAGHTHGGQIAPFGIAPFLPRGSGRYVSGWYRGDGMPLYVSRGLGTSVVPARLGAAPEIALFEWAVA